MSASAMINLFLQHWRFDLEPKDAKRGQAGCHPAGLGRLRRFVYFARMSGEQKGITGVPTVAECRATVGWNGIGS
jgi:hypothetical protein